MDIYNIVLDLIFWVGKVLVYCICRKKGQKKIRLKFDTIVIDSSRKNYRIKYFQVGIRHHHVRNDSENLLKNIFWDWNVTPFYLNMSKIIIVYKNSIIKRFLIYQKR